MYQHFLYYTPNFEHLVVLFALTDVVSVNPDHFSWMCLKEMEEVRGTPSCDLLLAAIRIPRSEKPKLDKFLATFYTMISETTLPGGGLSLEVQAELAKVFDKSHIISL